MGLDWQNNYFLILFAAAILHGLYLALIVFVRSEKGGSQIWLSVTLLGVSALLMNYFVYISDAISDYPNLLNVFVPLMFLTGPSFYLFIRKSENKTFSLQWFDLIHLVPILYISWESVAIFQWSTDQKLAAISGIFENHTPSFLEVILGNRFNFITAVYVIFSIFYLSSLRRGNERKELVRINWLRRFSITFLILLIASIIFPAVFLLTSINGAYLELTLTLMYAASIHVLGYFILKRKKGVPWVPAPVKYSTSPLDSDMLTKHKSRIISHLEVNKPWLKSDFSINDLSEQLSIPRHHLSQVLNEEIKMSFVDLVNSYRIEAAKSQLLSGALEKYSIIGIALDCGFASKSTFNRTFKKFTGVTPTSYSLSEKVSHE